ncbi:hypothetical protein FZEAL_9276 [Fusarium zealandicum]|uniref:Kynurenine formamidase n=1 Tax=Fusarium zealandicum TaxID=1053134 RepID=A0A8H4UCR5_9HYPO|nr:hypothetical protein FZEAL_9276 [Fusarium zealandicum]
MDDFCKPLGLTYKSHKYGENSRQKLGVWRFTDRQDQTSGYWVVFVHGGAWRDPRNTEDDAKETIKRVVISGAVATLDICGFISIDYRLSPHPDFAQGSTSTSKSEIHDAKHPDHVRDIWSALKFLQNDYSLENYIFVGHSAGATLGFQLLMGDDVLDGPQVPLPVVIIGVSGIYDLVGLNSRHDGNYAGFIQAAFGENETDWTEASPAHFGSSFKERWTSGKLVILAWSPEDTLIDEPEIDNMSALLTQHGLKPEVRKDLRGEHDFVWQDGSQIARLVISASHQLRRI